MLSLYQTKLSPEYEKSGYLEESELLRHHLDRFFILQALLLLSLCFLYLNICVSAKYHFKEENPKSNSCCLYPHLALTPNQCHNGEQSKTHTWGLKHDTRCWKQENSKMYFLFFISIFTKVITGSPTWLPNSHFLNLKD